MEVVATSVSCAVSEVVLDPPLGKRRTHVQQTRASSGSSMFVAGSPSAKRASPAARRQSTNPAADEDEGEGCDKGADAASDADEPRARELSRDEQADVDAVDKILALAFQVERSIREAEEDEKRPGVVGRVASTTLRRHRRASKELEDNFHALMGHQLERVFRRFDADGSGALDAAELRAAFEAAGRPADDDTIERAILALDTNSDGVISLDEFKAIAWRCATS